MVVGGRPVLGLLGLCWLLLLLLMLMMVVVVTRLLLLLVSLNSIVS